MLIKLKEYRGGERIVSLAKNEDTEYRMRGYGYDIVRLEGNRLVFLSDGYLYNLSEQELMEFDALSEYSVIGFYSNAYVYFNSGSKDNVIFVTNKCNSSCIMCPSSWKERKNSGIEPIDKLIKICSQIPSDVEHLTITGGEPFMLKDDIFYLFEFLKTKFTRTYFQLLTNGRCFAISSYLSRFVQTKPNHIIVGIPIHGHTAKLHDKITQVQGSFEQTCVGIKELLQNGIMIELRIVVSKLNMNFLNDIAEFIVKEFKGILNVKFIGLEMLGDARLNADDVWIEYDKSAIYMENAIEKLIINQFDVGIFNYPLCCVDRRFWAICENSITDYKICYLEECENCRVNNICGGMFRGTYNLLKDVIKAV